MSNRKLLGTTGAGSRSPLITAGAVVVAFALVVTLFGVFTGFSKTDGGQYDVVRNGGWFDDNSIRQVIQPNSGLVWTGFWSTDHFYPSSQRNFKVSATGEGDSDEEIDVSTADGVIVGIDGTFYFNLTADPAVLADFDNKFGTRTFPSGDGSSLHAWEDGDEGWRAFLRFSLGNLMKTIFREEVGKVKCQDLQASCALAIDPGATPGPSDPNALATFIRNVNTRFSTEVKSVLGGDFFVNPTFALGGVRLPENVVEAINRAVAARAAVSEAQARLQTAQVDAQTNAARQQGYNLCPTCADIDRLNALPDGLTTYAPGSGFAVTGR